MPRAFTLFLPLLLGLAWAPVPTLAQEDVTIYRCTGSGGKLTLRDSPCAKGETQDVRSMQRPKDPPPGRDARPPAAGKPLALPAREVQVIYRTEPRPMYECVDQSGRSYTSDDGFGNRRWMPLWTLGYPVWQQRNPGANQFQGPSGSPVPGGVIPARPGDRYASVVPGVVSGGGTWVSDECYPLPREEVCGRLSDRHYEIIRRYNTAGPSDRRQLDLEQRSVDARLASECGIN